MDNRRIAFKFVDHSIPDLSLLSESFPYRMKVKLLRREKLSREEKDKLMNDMDRGQIRLRGWCFSFRELVPCFWVKKLYYGISEVFAPDKTSIRKSLGSYNVQKIVLIK